MGKAEWEERERQGDFDGRSTFGIRKDTLKKGMTLNKISIHLITKTKRQIKCSLKNCSSFPLKNQRIEFGTNNSALN